MDDDELAIDARIALRIRTLRAARGLTLDALAERSGVSRAMISRIERGESSPTAVLLERLAAGLDTSLAALFDVTTSTPSPLSRHADQATWRDPQSGYLRRSLSPTQTSSPLRLVEVLFPAGARVTYEAVPRQVLIDQQVWLLEGVMDIAEGDTTQRLEAGDCLAMKLDAPHYFHNPTRKTARYLVAITTVQAR